MPILRCPAKVNLFLAIRGRGASGYHEIETVFARVPELFDEVQIEPSEKLQIEFSPGEGIDPKNNSVFKAIQLLEKQTSRTFPYTIRIIKNIPQRSGLGGGASNAASILLHLNEAENLGLNPAMLMALGEQIGMDVPFFLSGHEVAHATHYGEKITPLQPLPPEFKIKLELTGHEVSTPEAYQRWDRSMELSASAQKSARADIQPLLIALQNQDAKSLIAALHNDFEKVTPNCGPYSKTRHLCGSGGAVFTCVVSPPLHG